MAGVAHPEPGSSSRSRRWMRRRLNLQPGTDAEATIRRISAGTTLSAENAWLLICSAILASIGLNLSSAAVIIGAMLISPLMGPILGAGLALGTADRPLLLRAIRELGFGTLVSLLASAAYFALTPLPDVTPELLARTHPTLLDVGVALFGGIAGVVAASRREPSMALPGVAIATALMPPLCTAGFGLATGRWGFLAGAFYLYLINAIFIALATLAVVRVLRFPARAFENADRRRKELRLITAVAVLAAAPSGYFLYHTVIEGRERNRIESFLEREVETAGRAVPQWQIESQEDAPTLRVYIAGPPLSAERTDSLRSLLPQYGIRGLHLELVQADISRQDLSRLQGQVQRDFLITLQAALASRDSALAARQARRTTELEDVARELAATFPEIEAVSYARRVAAADSAGPGTSMQISFRRGVRKHDQQAILDRAQALVSARLGADTVAVVLR